MALFLLLETACIGAFVALDMILFYVFFEVTLVGMYFIIAGWGYEGRQRAALTFFLYTLLGVCPCCSPSSRCISASEPGTFDMRAIIASPPLERYRSDARPGRDAVTLFVKTPVFPLPTPGFRPPTSRRNGRQRRAGRPSYSSSAPTA